MTFIYRRIDTPDSKEVKMEGREGIDRLKKFSALYTIEISKMFGFFSKNVS